MSMIRLQKILADAGIASRRKSEEYIKKGLVKVNGKIIKELGVKIDQDKDKIEFKGKIVKSKKEEYVYIILNKPAGYVSTCKKGKERGRIVLDLIEKKKMLRLWPIGRLDKDSEGLLILTNDGELTNKLTHPKFEKEKEYEVEVNNPLDKEFLIKMQRGVRINGYKTRPAKTNQIGKNKFKIIIKEGKKRQIRKMCEILEYKVVKLKRIRIGKLRLGNLKKGEWKVLKKIEI